MNFIKSDEKLKLLLDEYLEGSGIFGSDYSYYAFLSWFDDLEYAESGGALYLRAFFNGELRYWIPLTKHDVTLEQAVAALPAECTFCSATDKIVAQLGDDYAACTNRDWSEYIYRSSDFIGLVGKRYNAKRNHISKFLRLYSPQMLPYSEKDREECDAFEEEWLAARDFDGNMRESAVKERKIVRSWLAAAASGELVCDVLRVDGKMAGISIAHLMSSGNAVVMYEKADIAYEGIYSYLAHEFAARNLSSCEYINRQEDMGLEGLRKSKLSYYPEIILDKYILTPKSLCFKNGRFAKPCEGDSSLTESPQSKAPDKPADSETYRDSARKAGIEEYEFRQLNLRDFNIVMRFLKCGISGLDNKLFFMNYTDDELGEVLEKGYMLGAFYEGHLVATCAFDPDKRFGDKLAAICSDKTKQYYEFSGIMVCPHHRGKGLAYEICGRVIEYAKLNYPDSVLCATVQFDNEASLANLKKLGFVKRASAAYKEYDFVYLTLEI